MGYTVVVWVCRFRLAQSESYAGRDGLLHTLLGLASEAEMGDGRGNLAAASPSDRPSVAPAKVALTSALFTVAVQLGVLNLSSVAAAGAGTSRVARFAVI